MVAEVGTSVRAPWEVFDERSEDRSRAGADSAADVPFAVEALSWSDIVGAVGAATTTVFSWMAGETVGRIRTGTWVMFGCRASVGDNPDASCAAWEVEAGDPFTTIPRRGGRSVPGLSASS